MRLIHTRNAGGWGSYLYYGDDSNTACRMIHVHRSFGCVIDFQRDDTLKNHPDSWEKGAATAMGWKGAKMTYMNYGFSTHRVLDELVAEAEAATTNRTEK